MPAPTVTDLPQAPARLSRPTNFVTESTLFLDNLPRFRSEVNTLSSYFNSIYANKYNYGSVVGKRTFPNIFQTITPVPDQTDVSIKLTSAIDQLYSVLVEYSRKLNDVGSWFDSLIQEHGHVPYDLEKPLINGITKAMTRDQNREAFNSTSESFSESAIDNIDNLYQSMFHTYQQCYANNDSGSIADTVITQTIDAGSIADKTIEYT